MAGDRREQPPREPADEPQEEAGHPIDGRLREYLRRLVDANGGRMKAADALGVNNKTLARGLDDRRPLTDWLRAWLLLKALGDGVAALAWADEQAPGGPGTGDAGPAAGHIGNLAGEVREATEVLRSLATAVEQLRQEHSERLDEIERRLTEVEEQPRPGESVEPPPRPGDAPAAAVIGAPRIAVRGPATGLPQTAPPGVVTEDAGPDDERAYGAAWPLVEEWRAVHARHPAGGTGLDWLRDEERLRELEIALIGEHELALPPERYRWDAFTRRSQLRWRERTLRRVRGERRRAQWLRRLLTLGLGRA